MVSSVAPIKAKKVRYYSDANFQRRVLPPLCSLRGATPTCLPYGPTTGAG